MWRGQRPLGSIGFVTRRREMEGQGPQIRDHAIRCDTLEHDLVLVRHAEEDDPAERNRCAVTAAGLVQDDEDAVGMNGRHRGPRDDSGVRAHRDGSAAWPDRGARIGRKWADSTLCPQRAAGIPGPRRPPPASSFQTSLEPRGAARNRRRPQRRHGRPGRHGP